MIWEILKEYSLIIEEICFLFASVHLGIRSDKKGRILFLYVLLMIAVMRFTLPIDGFYKVAVYEAMDLLAFFFIFRLPILKKITYYVFSYVVCGAVEVLLIWLVIGGSPLANEVAVSASSFFLLRLLLSMLFLVIGQIRWRKIREISFSLQHYWYLSLTVCLFAISLAGFLFIEISDSISDRQKTVQLSIILLGIILVLNTAGIISLAQRKKLDQEIISLQNELLHMQQKHFSTLNEKQLAIRKMKHDMNGHLIMIDKLNRSRDSRELQDYLDNILALNQQNSYSDYDTGNKTASIIINYFADLFRDHDIIFNFEGYFEKIKMSEFEINSLLYNALTNAYEECMRLSDHEAKEIHLSIKKLKRTLMIVVKNSCRGSLLTEEKNSMKTSKNPDEHGYGIKIMTGIAEKYDGEIKIYHYDKTWTVEMIFLDIFL